MAPDRVRVLLDTDVLVEVLRQKPAAQVWLAANPAMQAAIPSIVAMELYLGCPNKREMESTRRTLGAYATVHIQERDSLLALQLFRTHRLSSGLSIADTLIAAMAVNRKETLLSFNVKHFSAIKALSVREPYDR